MQENFKQIYSTNQGLQSEKVELLTFFNIFVGAAERKREALMAHCRNSATRRNAHLLT